MPLNPLPISGYLVGLEPHKRRARPRWKRAGLGKRLGYAFGGVALYLVIVRRVKRKFQRPAHMDAKRCRVRDDTNGQQSRDCSAVCPCNGLLKDHSPNGWTGLMPRFKSRPARRAYSLMARLPADSGLINALSAGPRIGMKCRTGRNCQTMDCADYRFAPLGIARTAETKYCCCGLVNIRHEQRT